MVSAFTHDLSNPNSKPPIPAKSDPIFTVMITSPVYPTSRMSSRGCMMAILSSWLWMGLLKNKPSAVHMMDMEYV
jgi:hypothetical protein